MAVCEVCTRTPFFKLPAFPSWLRQHLPVRAEHLTVFENVERDNPENLPFGFEHHKSIADLEEAAKTCDVCGIISAEFSRTVKTYRELNVENSKKYLDPIGEPEGQLWICDRKEGAEGFIVLCKASKKDEVWQVAVGGYCVAHDSPLSTRFRGRVVPRDPTSPATLRQIQDWLSESEKQATAPRAHSRLPSRVLDCSDSPSAVRTIRLQDSDNESEKYATLSHRWDVTSTSWTSANYQSKLREGIDLSELPQSYQDAVTVIRSLGVRYLWIDSLCMGDRDDVSNFSRDSLAVSEIYSNSYLTIAATRSGCDSDGFLGLRTARQYASLLYPQDDTAADGTVFVFPVSHELAALGRSYLQMRGEPLSDRAWALHKRYLSPRTIHLGSSQIYFEDRKTFATEDGYLHPDPLYYLGNNTEGSAEIVDPFSLKWRGPRSWQSIIYTYSDLKLSDPFDKLPALAGIARAHENFRNLSHTEGQNYYAGLWRDNLVEDLCWQAVGGRCTRPPGYRAPSWSWAALDGRTASTPLAPYTDIAEVEDIQVGTVNSDPYGAVTDARLTLKAPIIPLVRLERKFDSTWEMQLPAYVNIVSMPDYDDSRWSFTADVCDEALPEQLDGVDLSLLVLAYKKAEESAECQSGRCGSGSRVMGLVIQRVEGGGKEYMRLGWTACGSELLVDHLVSLKSGNSSSVTLV